MEALFEPPLEEAGAGGGDAASHYLRSALSARPRGLAGLCSGSGPQHGKEPVTKEKGDTSNELRRGHFSPENTSLRGLRRKHHRIPEPLQFFGVVARELVLVNALEIVAAQIFIHATAFS